MTEADEIGQFARDIHEAQDENIPQRTRDVLWNAPVWSDRRENIEVMAEVLWAMGYRKVENE